MNKFLSPYIEEIKNVSNKGLFHLFTANGLIYLVGFASQLFVAGLLDPADIGRIKIMQAYIGLTSLGVGLGFNTSMIKRLAGVTNEKEKARLLQLTLIISLGSFVVFYFLLLLLNYLKLISTDHIIINLFPFYALFLLPLGLQSMLIAFYQANKEIQKMARLQFLAKIITFVLIISLTYFLGIKGYVFAIPVAGIITICILLLRISSTYKKALLKKYKFTKKDFKELWLLAKFALAANVLGNLITSVDIYIVNYMIEERELVGYYMFALTLVGVMNILPVTIQQIAYPYFTDKAIDKTSWLHYYQKYNQLNHVFLVLISLIALFVVPAFVKFAFQGKYDASLHFYIFLMIAWLLTQLNGMKGTALMGAGRFDLNMYSSLLSLLFTLVLLLVLGYFFDLNGIVAARIISGIGGYLITLLIFKKFMNKTFA